MTIVGKGRKERKIHVDVEARDMLRDRVEPGEANLERAVERRASLELEPADDEPTPRTSEGSWSCTLKPASPSGPPAPLVTCFFSSPVSRCLDRKSRTLSFCFWDYSPHPC
jgi:hypothetical protein